MLSGLTTSQAGKGKERITESVPGFSLWPECPHLLALATWESGEELVFKQACYHSEKLRGSTNREKGENGYWEDV